MLKSVSACGLVVCWQLSFKSSLRKLYFLYLAAPKKFYLYMQTTTYKESPINFLGSYTKKSVARKVRINYSAFGAIMPGRNFNSTDYRYGYGGHEKMDEVSGSGNEIDMGDRWLDTRLGKTLKPDRKAGSYPDISPYAYALNNPIINIDPDGEEVVWHVKFQKSKQFQPIIAALNKTDVYNTIFTRFIKNQDNVFIKPTARGYFGMADPARKANGYDLNLGLNGFLKNGYLTADATFIAKVIMHEGLHQRYNMAQAEGNEGDYPTLKRHMDAERGDPSGNYEGDHEAMAEGNVAYFVKGMKQFDAAYGTSHSEDWYNAMAWFGSLQRATDDWKNMDAGQKAKYQSLIDNEQNYMGYLDARATYKKDKTAANKAAMNTAKGKVDWKLFNKSRNK